MPRSFRPTLSVLAGVLALGVATSQLSGRVPSTMPRTADGEWPHYAADWRGSRYSHLDQVNATNFSALQLAWRFKTDNLGPRPEYNLEGTPLMVKGVLYATAGSRRAMIALDAKTGELLWMHSMHEGTRADASPRKLSGRGLAYWTDGKGDERIAYVTIGYRLVVLNAKTGQPVPSFGSKGAVDLKEGLITGTDTPIDLETGEAGLLATPTVAKDVVLVGLALGEGLSIPTHNNTKGVVRAFDVRTGKKLWEFNTIPRPGEFGNDTWLENSWAYNGKVGIWTQMTVDQELGLVYVPVETPASDMYGGRIHQTPELVTITFDYGHAYRWIWTDGSRHPEALDFWMADSRGRWEGDTLVVDVANFNDRTWFDRAGNFHSDALHMVERFTPRGPDHILYEATIEDPKTFSRPWKISLPLYRRIEPNVQTLDYECLEFEEPLLNWDDLPAPGLPGPPKR